MFYKEFTNEVGVLYKSTRKVYIQGVIDNEMNKYNQNIFVEIDFGVRTRIWQICNYFEKYMEQVLKIDTSRFKFRCFRDNLWDDGICCVEIRCTDEVKIRSFREQRKDCISYRDCVRGDEYNEMSNIYFFLPHKFLDSTNDDVEKVITVSYSF